MTLEQAAEILDREHHREAACWYVHEISRTAIGYNDDGSPVEHLSEFEAIAIAREYERLATAKALSEISGVLGGFAVAPGDEAFFLRKPLD